MEGIPTVLFESFKVLSSMSLMYRYIEKTVAIRYNLKYKFVSAMPVIRGFNARLYNKLALWRRI